MQSFVALTAVSLLPSEGGLTEIPLPFPAWAFGIIALVVFFALLGVLWVFRGTALKHLAAQEVHIDDVPGTHVNTGYDSHPHGT